jgi:hypothetical protein
MSDGPEEPSRYRFGLPGFILFLVRSYVLLSVAGRISPIGMPVMAVVILIGMVTAGGIMRWRG